MIDIVAFVPIKLNSERIKNKSIQDLGGKPLYFHILETLSKLDIDTYLWCSQEVDVPNGIKFLKRDEKYDTNSTTANDLVSGFYEQINSDWYINAFATSPFISSNSIQTCIDLASNGMSSFLAKSIIPFVWKDNLPLYNVDHIPRTQDMPKYLIETSGLYCYPKEWAKDGIRIKRESRPVFINDIESIDIDYPEDLEIARKIWSHL